MLAVVQSFDPLGVAARTVAECVTLQLRALEPQTPGLATALVLAAQPPRPDGAARHGRAASRTAR